jgi:hypothetical protein
VLLANSLGSRLIIRCGLLGVEESQLSRLSLMSVRNSRLYRLVLDGGEGSFVGGFMLRSRWIAMATLRCRCDRGGARGALIGVI